MPPRKRMASSRTRMTRERPAAAQLSRGPGQDTCRRQRLRQHDRRRAVAASGDRRRGQAARRARTGPRSCGRNIGRRVTAAIISPPPIRAISSSAHCRRATMPCRTPMRSCSAIWLRCALMTGKPAIATPRRRCGKASAAKPSASPAMHTGYFSALADHLRPQHLVLLRGAGEAGNARCAQSHFAARRRGRVDGGGRRRAAEFARIRQARGRRQSHRLSVRRASMFAAGDVAGALLPALEAAALGALHDRARLANWIISSSPP